MMLTFRTYDASSCHYPRPRIPVMPPLTLTAVGSRASSRYPTCFDGRAKNLFVRGRYALFHALRTLGVGKQDSVLVPAYHCRTMIDPVVQSGAEVCLFPLNPDLSPDLDRLARLVESASLPPKALLLPHYFGYPQDIEPVVAFCNQRSIALIEDCCHAYFGSWRGRALGSWGHCAIGSPSKFFACEDGGTYFSSSGGQRALLRRRPLADELRAVYHSAESAWAHMKGQFNASPLTALATQFESTRIRFPEWAVSAEETGSLSQHFRPETDLTSALSWSRWVMRLSSVEQLCERRRSNFNILLEGVKNLPNCRPLFPTLPTGVVPYMFPLLIERPEHRFHWLKHLGMPMYRWDELAVSACAISDRYRLHLVQLPCHQAMHRNEMTWMLQALSVVMRAQLDGEH